MGVGGFGTVPREKALIYRGALGDMNRRAVLALLSAGIAGCSGDPVDDAQEPSSEPTSSSRTDSATASPTQQPVSNLTFRSSLRYLHNDDAVDVVGPNRDQFVAFYPPIEDSPPRAAFELALGERTFGPIEQPGFLLETPGIGPVYRESEPGYLLFDVPTVEVESAALIRTDVGTRRPFKAETLPEFATSPELRLRALDVPETVAVDESVELQIEVANRGDRNGLFLGAIQLETRYVDVATEVPTGEARAETAIFAHGSEAGEEFRFSFVHAGGFSRQTIDVVSA